LPITRFIDPPSYVLQMLDDTAPDRLESLAAGRHAMPASAGRAFRAFYLPIEQLREETRSTVEPVQSGWCYLEQRGGGFEVLELFEPTQGTAEWIRHGFGDSHPIAAAVAVTLAPTFSLDTAYELRLLQIPPILPPSLWIVPEPGATEWIMPTADGVEGIVPGIWYDMATFTDRVRAAVRGYIWDEA
jgi:hypothetical protein